MTQHYTYASNPLDPNPRPHPRGMIGAMYANRLIDAGWTEDEDKVSSYGEWWIDPVDGSAYTLQGAIALLDKRLEKPQSTLP